MAISVPIIASFDGRGVNKAIRDFKKLEGAGNKMAFGLLNTTAVVNKGIAQFAKFGAAASIVSGVIGKKLIDAGSNLEESMSKVNVVFGDSAKGVQDFASNAAKSMGISNQKALEAAGTFGNLLQAFGTTREAAAQMSMKMVQLAGDLASFNNVPVEEALMAIRSGLSGESEPLKRFGIAINDVRLKQEALTLKLYDGKGPLSVLAKTQAAYSLILKDSALAQGDYSRTSDGVANMQRTLMATFQDISAELGTALLPAFKTVLGFINDNLLPVFRTFSDIVGAKGLGAGFKYLGEQGLEALGKLDGWGNLVYGVVAAVVALNVAVGLYTALQTLATIAMTLFGTAATGTAVALNVAFAGIPALMGLIVVAIVALALRFKGFREFLSSLIPAFKFVFNGIANIVEFQINNIIRSINLFIRIYNALPFVDDVKTLDHISLGFDKVAKSVGKVASAADFRKFEGFQPIDSKKLPKPPKTPVLPTGGGKGITAIEKAKTALDKYTSALKQFDQETKQHKQALKDVADAQLSLANATDDVRVAQDKFNKISKGYGAGSKEAAIATRDLADANRSAVRATMSLRDATRSVADAQKEYDDLISGKGIATAKEELSIADDKVAAARQALEDAKQQYRSYDDQADATDVLNDALKEQREAQQKVAEEQAKVSPQAIADAQQQISDAVLDQEDAQIALKDAQQDVIDKQNELHDVVNGAATDSQKYKDAQKELTDAQKAERDAVDLLTDAYDRQKDAIRELEQAKIDLADAAKGTTSKQERDAQIKTGITVPITGDMGDNGFSGGNMVLPSIDFSGIDFSGIDFSAIDLSAFMPFMAEGGIVNKPTIAMIGESGSEAVIPLSQLGKMGGATYNITVNAGITSTPAQIGQQIIDAIKTAERKSGQVFASA